MTEVKTKKYKVKATLRQKKALDNLVANGGNVTQAMRDAGYSEATANTPQKLTESQAWAELMKEYLPDDKIAEKHRELLHATTLDHQVFALGPKNEEDKEKYILADREKADKEGKEYKEIDYVTDEDIIEMLAEINCKVRRIVHRETARDVYFWTADNRPRKDAIDMAYKLKGSYAPEKSLTMKVNLSDDKQNKSNELIEGILRNSKNT